jgi:hypothetical protein
MTNQIQIEGMQHRHREQPPLGWNDSSLSLSRALALAGTLWRGVKRKLTEEFPIGLKFRWWRFSSCTMDGEVLKNPLFLGQSGALRIYRSVDRNA